MLLNIKYYNFDSSFDTIEFGSRKVTRRCGSDILNNTRTNIALRCCNQKQTTPTRSPKTGPTVEFGPLTGNRPRHHQKGEKNYLHKLDKQEKA
jgi:hypothetical protein